jgi:hypothetical protein
MCPDPDSASAGFDETGNPLYEYLLDLQKKRMWLLEALAPRRHFAWQMWATGSILALWLVDRFVPDASGLPMAMLILLGPFAILSGLYLSGWYMQMIAAKNYPSPLDSPNALELLLSTPLTEVEIVQATIFTYLRYPFLGITWARAMHVAMNLGLLGVVIYDSILRGTAPVDILLMSVGIYIPAACIFLFFPVLNAVDVLLVPSGWLRRSSRRETDASEAILGRGGRLPGIAALVCLAPVFYELSSHGIVAPALVIRVIEVSCPLIIVTLGVVSTILIALLPSHLRTVRRS